MLMLYLHQGYQKEAPSPSDVLIFWHIWTKAAQLIALSSLSRLESWKVFDSAFVSTRATYCALQHYELSPSLRYISWHYIKYSLKVQSIPR